MKDTDSDSVGLPVLVEERNWCRGGVCPVGLQTLVGKRISSNSRIAS